MFSKPKALEMREYARALERDGVTVIPIVGGDNLRQLNDRVLKEMWTWPEYKRGLPPTHQRVLGGFGALGNPSSFHTKFVRLLRAKVLAPVGRKLFKEYLKERGISRSGVNMEVLFDRVCIRCEDFKRPTAENWHRDVFEGDLPSFVEETGEPDPMFGGWVNLNAPGGVTQKLLALKGTHKGEEAILATREGKGFATFTKEQIAERGFEARMREQGPILVPPGHLVVFKQSLIHSVASGKQSDWLDIRLFSGFRLTRSKEPLFGQAYLDAIIARGGVPRIPSGETPPMYSRNHSIQFQKDGSYYQTWAANTFVEQCLFERKTTTGKTYFTPGKPGDPGHRANKTRSMLSLADYGLWNARFRYRED